jgi:hypothetical protein
VFEEVFITITLVPLEAQETAENISHEMVLYMTRIYMSRLFCGFSVERRRKFDMPNEPVEKVTSLNFSYSQSLSIPNYRCLVPIFFFMRRV